MKLCSFLWFGPGMPKYASRPNFWNFLKNIKVSHYCCQQLSDIVVKSIHAYFCVVGAKTPNMEITMVPPVFIQDTTHFSQKKCLNCKNRIFSNILEIFNIYHSLFHIQCCLMIYLHSATQFCVLCT